MYPKLPDVRQSTPVSCGPGVLETVWTYFNVSVRPIPVTPIDGCGPDTVEAALWHSGLCVQAGTMDLGDLHYHTKKGRPVICLVTEPGGAGHWVVVERVRARQVQLKGWDKPKLVRYVKLQCPTDGPKWESAVRFVRRWHDKSHRRGVAYARWGIAVFKGPA